MSESGGLAFENYQSGGRREWLMRIGGADARPILFLPPLFEELNRTRALIADIMRRLARRGYGCWLPDLPGTGESGQALGDVRWADWREAAAAAGEAAIGPSGLLVASLRGGCLLDNAVAASARWRLAPVSGASLSRDLTRAGLLSNTHYAGYEPSSAMMDDLAAAEPAEAANVRIVRLASDRGDADLSLEGPALWRRSEPGCAPDLALAIANDLENWAERCAGC